MGNFYIRPPFFELLEATKDTNKTNVLCVILRKYSTKTKTSIVQQTYIEKLLNFSHGKLYGIIKDLKADGWITTTTTTWNGRRTTTEFTLTDKLKKVIHLNEEKTKQNKKKEERTQTLSNDGFDEFIESLEQPTQPNENDEEIDVIFGTQQTEQPIQSHEKKDEKINLTIANKRLKQKPIEDDEKGKYFYNLSFDTKEVNLNELKVLVSNGFTLSYLFKDKAFVRKPKYMSNNYLGTQFVCVDVDKCDISPKDFFERIKYKPTILHTSFLNKTKEKENKWCYHLLYCFDGIIYGEKNFTKAFDTLTSDYTEFVDSDAKDCHRCFFTSNSTLPNYEIITTNLIYST